MLFVAAPLLLGVLGAKLSDTGECCISVYFLFFLIFYLNLFAYLKICCLNTVVLVIFKHVSNYLAVTVLVNQV